MSFYDDASWLLIPSGIKEDVVYAQKPTSGLGDLTFTRASDATYTDSTGVVRRSPYNLLQFSEQFDNAAWTKSGVTVTANQAISPYGYTNADLLTPTISDSSIRQSTIPASVSAYTFSVWLRSATGSNISTTIRVWRDSPFQNITNTAITVTSTWQRFTLNFTPIDLTSHTVAIGGSSTLSSGENLFAWGAQLVEGSVPLDYFPTTNRQDVPRIDFRNADGTLSSCGRLLLEPQRTNLALYSEQLDNAAWTKSGVTVTANNTQSPGGYQNADKVTNASTADFISQIITAPTATAYASSFYIKNEDSTTTTVLVRNAASSLGGNINWTGSQLVSITGVVNGTLTFQSVGNDWYRIFAYFTSVETVQRVRIIPDATATGKSVYLWGFQLEQGATYATTYIPTTTAAVTRIADAATKTGVSSLIGQTEGTLFVDFVYSAKTGNNRFSISSGSTANWIFIGTPEDASTNKSRFYIRTNNTIQVDVGTTAYFTFGQRYKLALAYKSGSWAVYGNGTLLYSGTNSIAAVSSPLSVLNFFQETGAVCDAAELMNEAALFPTRLTNAELATLTTL